MTLFFFHDARVFLLFRPLPILVPLLVLPPRRMTEVNIATTINPLDLPEIRLVLADILSFHALAVCARVCKDWNISMPSLWRHVSIGVEDDKATLSSTPAMSLAIKQRELIQNLTIQGIMGPKSHVLCKQS